MSRNILVGKATGWTAGVQFLTRADFPISVASRPAVGPTQPLIRVYYILLQSRRGMKLTTHIRLVPMSIKLEPYLHSPIFLNGTVHNAHVLRTWITLTLHFARLQCSNTE
jgi:hypothetical protein